jgi:hypothetical protein
VNYDGQSYLTWPEIEAFCTSIADRCPEFVQLSEIGRSRHDRPIVMLTIGAVGGAENRPAMWLDGGTHASEFTGVMAALHCLETWVSLIEADDEATLSLFSQVTAFVAPCLSPDGYDFMRSGGHFIRSSLRPPAEGAVISGWEPSDQDGDGVIRYLRWRHPAGPFVPDSGAETLMRPRTLDDDPSDAYFVTSEGTFVEWDGMRWTQAPRRYGIDLNRNFPAGWSPFSMFGMDSGAYGASEPESRAAVEAVRQRPTIAAALTNHTYTGCILTQPYSQNSTLTGPEISLMHDLAKDLVAGTHYRVFKVHPEFVYDPKVEVVGVWSDTLATVFGIPGYTVEFWDPFGYAGVPNESPAEFFKNPDIEKIRTLVSFFERSHPELVQPWTEFEHPQLGRVEVGGLDYLRTVRNPPEALLKRELEVGRIASDRMLRALPNCQVELQLIREGSLRRLRLSFENLGYLGTESLRAFQECPRVSATLELGEGLTLVSGTASQELPHLDGWGTARATNARNPVYPSLAARGHRQVAEWWVRGEGHINIQWTAGRAGSGSLERDL